MLFRSLVTSQFSANANGMEALTAKNKVLTREIEEQQKKVTACEQVKRTDVFPEYNAMAKALEARERENERERDRERTH